MIKCTFCGGEFISAQFNSGKSIINSCGRKVCKEKLELELPRLRKEFEELNPIQPKNNKFN